MRTPLNAFFLKAMFLFLIITPKATLHLTCLVAQPLYHEVKSKPSLLIKKITMFEIKTDLTFNRFCEAKLSYFHED